MFNRRNTPMGFDSDPVTKFGSLSYGLDFEEDGKISDDRQLELPKYLWRIILMDATLLWHFRSFLQKAGLYLFLIISLAAISGLIVCPCKLHSFPQVEVLSKEKAQHSMPDPTLDSDEMKTSTISIDREGTYTKVQINELNKEVHLKVLDLCKGAESKILTSDAIKYKRKCNAGSMSKDDSLSESKIYAQQGICMSNNQNQFTYDDLFLKITNLEKRIKEITSIMLDSRFKEPGQCTLLPEEHEIRKIAREEIIKREYENYGLADFALENSGGSIISTPKTITYSTKTMILLFGFPLWLVGSNPSNLIQASVNPGDCWAFRGTFGNIRIKLAVPIIISSFSMYHIPKQLSPTGKIKSAPKTFSVVAIKDELQAEVTLGNFQYDENGPPKQSFLAQTILLQPTSIVELRIHSNYGNELYTCLYRFQVHGKIPDYQL